MNEKLLTLLPGLDPEEYNFISDLTKELTDEQLKTFALRYRVDRKDPQNILIFALLGFIGPAGIHRLVLNQIGMGILYILTLGLCYVGTIIDLVNHKKITFEYNQQKAREAFSFISANS